MKKLSDPNALLSWGILKIMLIVSLAFLGLGIVISFIALDRTMFSLWLCFAALPVVTYLGVIIADIGYVKRTIISPLLTLGKFLSSDEALDVIFAVGLNILVLWSGYRLYIKDWRDDWNELMTGNLWVIVVLVIWVAFFIMALSSIRDLAEKIEEKKEKQEEIKKTMDEMHKQLNDLQRK